MPSVMPHWLCKARLANNLTFAGVKSTQWATNIPWSLSSQQSADSDWDTILEYTTVPEISCHLALEATVLCGLFTEGCLSNRRLASPIDE